MNSSACIEMLFTEYPFLDRIAKAAEAGFTAIEFWEWKGKDMAAIKDAADKAGIKIAGFVGSAGGTLINPAHRDGYVAGVAKSLEFAKELGVPSLILVTDELGEDRGVRYRFPELSEEEKYQSVLDGLKAIAPLAEAAGVTMVLEPLNTLVDHAGYFLNSSKPGFALLQAVNSPRIKMLFDIYHMQIMEGNIIASLQANIDMIGHIHVADVPGRHEPGSGELNYVNIFRALNKAGYQQYIGFEYEPTGSSEVAAASSLAMIREAKAAV